MGNTVKIGIADMSIVASGDSVMTIGLGSCVGIAIRDTITKTGGLIHIMLPDSTAVKSNTNKLKFADTGIVELVKALELKGCKRSNLVAKIAGGAQMFSFQNKSDLLGVGARNVEAVKAALKSLGIRIISEDVGENYGRTVEFFPETGEYYIRAVGKPEKVI